MPHQHLSRPARPPEPHSGTRGRHVASCTPLQGALPRRPTSLVHRHAEALASRFVLRLGLFLSAMPATMLLCAAVAETEQSATTLSATAASTLPLRQAFDPNLKPQASSPTVPSSGPDARMEPVPPRQRTTAVDARPMSTYQDGDPAPQKLWISRSPAVSVPTASHFQPTTTPGPQSFTKTTSASSKTRRRSAQNKGSPLSP